MSSLNRNRSLVAAAALAVAGLGLTACSSSDTMAPDTMESDAMSSDAMTQESMSPGTMTEPSSGTAMTAEFGTACAAVPSTGPGSFEGMSADPVATAASNNPVLSTLVTAATKAKLVSTLNSADELTVFAPVNDAFAAVPKDTLNALLMKPKKLGKLLTYHVVAGQLTPAELAGTHKTLAGPSLTVTGSGENFLVNDSATVVCGNVKTANATVYLVDQVLMPSAK